MPEKTGRLVILMGGLFGSEGKGIVAAHIANEYDFHVRVGGPNAGHSFKVEDRRKDSAGFHTFKMQSIPCGWINPNATLVVGAGGIVDPEQIRKELAEIVEFDPSIRSRLVIDANATVLDEYSRNEEGGTRGTIHQDIGSTGEGVGAARRRRMARDPQGKRDAANRVQLAKDIDSLKEFIAPDTSQMLHEALTNGKSVLIEGTQGSGLSLIHGPYPYTTSADTNAAQMLADVGLPPAWVDDIIMVVRTFPIRVSGNSGPLKDEVDWDFISQRMGRDTIERTTVTKKVRRIGKWDEALFLKAVRLNAPTQLALTFVDYLTPADEGVDNWLGLSVSTRDFIYHLESISNAKVTFVGTGGDGWAIVDRRSASTRQKI